MSDHEPFHKKLPYETKPLNIPGAFTTPFPPAGFDPMTASPKELVKHGILVRRPDHNDPPHLVEAWKRIFGRKFKPEDRIVPHLVPQVGKKHILTGLKKADTGFTNCAVERRGVHDRGALGDSDRPVGDSHGQQADRAPGHRRVAGILLPGSASTGGGTTTCFRSASSRRSRPQGVRVLHRLGGVVGRKMVT